MRVIEKDLRNRRESLVKLIDRQREEFAFNSRPLRNTSNKIDAISSQVHKIVKPFSYIAIAVSFFRMRATLRHPLLAIKKYSLLGSVLKQGFQLIVNRKPH